MLEFIRKYLGSFFVKAVLSLVAFTFILFFGISDVINRFTGKDYFLKVGGVKVNTSQFQVLYNKKLELLRRQAPSSLELDKYSNQIFASVLGELIEELSIEQIFDIWDLAAIDDNIVKFVLQNSPAFKDKNGVFNSDALRNTLAMRQIPESVFLSELKLNTSRSMIMMPLSLLFNEPKVLIQNVTNAALENRSVDIVYIYNSAVPKMLIQTPSKAELESHYENNQNEFVEPESRDITVLVLDENKVLNSIKISDEEISEQYQLKKAEEGEDWNESLDQVRSELITEIQQSKFADEIKSLTAKIEDEIASNKNVNSIAQKYGLSVLNLKDLLTNNTIRSTKKTAIAKPYGSEISSLAFSGGNFNVFQETTHGVQFLILLDKVSPSFIPKYGDIQPSVVASWEKSARIKAAKKMALDLTNAVSKTQSLYQLANKQRLTVDSYSSLTRSGEISPNRKLPHDVTEKIFNAKIGQTLALEVEGGQMLVHITGKSLPKLQDAQMQQVKASLHNDMVNDLFSQLIKYYGKKIKVDVNQDALKPYSKGSD